MKITKKEGIIILTLVFLEQITVILSYLYFDNIDSLFQGLLIVLNLFWLLLIRLYIKKITYYKNE